jgi:PIN domain nuclease of toxin-antitoxin system
VRLLLDTHALLWALSTPAKLPAPISRAIRDPTNAVFISAASAWEIAIKVGLGKLSADVDEIVSASLEAGFDELAITLAHAVRVRALPSHHRDPFDRMLIAQAVEEGLTVVTRDAAITRYGVSILWG